MSYCSNTPRKPVLVCTTTNLHKNVWYAYCAKGWVGPWKSYIKACTNAQRSTTPPWDSLIVMATTTWE